MSNPTSPGRGSPPTERVVRILDFLADRADQRFGLSELARRLDLSKPTCLGIVTVLCDGGAKYQSRLFNQDWVRERGFLDAIG